jgi:ABC-type antimicrobial peptide transport system permease subunit
VDDLLYHLNQRPSAMLYPDEVWLRLHQSDAAHAGAVLDAITARGGVVVLDAHSRAAALDALQSDPLGLGLMGLMYLGFLMALALSIVGLLTYAALTAQARRGEFGVLRALGLSTLRLLRTLALEQVAVMLIGVALGALLGGLLTSQVVPSLAYDTTGRQIIPPFVMRVGTRQLLDYSAGMLAVLLLILGSSMLLVRRLSVAQTLRLGDE